jgi:two-component system nitrogen regulation sensor histidine kinase NtrY
MNPSLDSTAPASSFMKLPRAHYRMRGGKFFAGAIVLMVAALIMLVLKIDTAYFGNVSPQRTVMLVMIDLGILLVLMVYAVQQRARLLWTRAHDGMLGTRLQSRIILMFSGIAIVPTLIVVTFSILFFNVGIKSWFDTQVSGALEDSVVVATAYIDEHKDAIRTDALGLSESVQAQSALLLSNPAAFANFLSNRSAERNLSEAIVFDRQRVMARTALSFSLTFERLPEEVLSRADSGQVAIFGDDQNKIQAVTKIAHAPDLYLLVARVVDPKVLQHMEAARQTVGEYHQFQQALAALQKQFFVVFILIALLILLASLWAGILLAVRLIEPLRALMLATEHVRGGDYSIRVPEGRADDEIANLGRTFNRMTGQLENQRRDLIEANRLADERRRFTEAVLLGVSAGIIALNQARVITLNNRTALELLGREHPMIGESIEALLPEVKQLIEQVAKKPERIASDQIMVQHGEKRVTLHVQVTAEQLGNAIEGYIVTFDDITDLVVAQRSAAWADVARRIAHEIKNPLTPITLSAERLRKKFGPSIASDDRESYDKYIDTIARHTRDIGRMVEEFVAYARLPSSVFRMENLVGIVRKSVFSAQTTGSDITYIQEYSAEEITMLCDEAQLGQALLNLLKNAAEALEGREQKRITVRLSADDAHATLIIEDNGAGFPADKIATLTEPYVTTRAKGTGLGLAIVKRSVEEHKGTLGLSNPEAGGARVTIVFPLV